MRQLRRLQNRGENAQTTIEKTKPLRHRLHAAIATGRPSTVDPEVKKRHRQLMAELNELAREGGKFKSREPTRSATPDKITEVIRGAFPFDDANARVTAEHLMAHLDRCGIILSRRY